MDTRLPIESTRQVSWREVVKCFALALSGLALINMGIYALDRRFPLNSGDTLQERKWGLILQAREPLDWLFLGDSSCNQGFDTDLLRREEGVSAINACTIGDALAINDAWMLGELIHREVVPERVVIIHVHDMWWRSSERLQSFLWSMGHDRETFDRLRPEIPQQRGAWNALHRLFLRVTPMYSRSVSVRRRLGHPGRALNYFRNCISGEEWVSETGFMPRTSSDPDQVSSDVASHLERLAGSEARISDENQAALREIMSLSTAHGIQVDFVLSPVSRSLAESSLFQTRVHELSAQIRALVPEEASVDVHEWILSYPGSQMENADHLVGEAAQDYTRRLYSRLRQQ